MFRTILSTLVVVVAFGSATNLQAANIESSIKHTAWIGESTDAKGNKVPTAMTFRSDGNFCFLMEVGGKIEKLEGTYTIENNVIKVTVLGENLVLDVVSVDGESLVTKGKNGQTKWERIKK